jgi:hypothetical protein
MKLNLYAALQILHGAEASGGLQERERSTVVQHWQYGAARHVKHRSGMALMLWLDWVT